MRLLSIVLILAVAAAGLFASPVESDVPPTPHLATAVAKPAPAVVEPATAPSRPSPRIARKLDDREKDSVLGLMLLVTLKRGAQAR